MDTGTNTCIACRVGSISIPGSVSVTQCICPEDSYLAADGITCNTCPTWSSTNSISGLTSVTGCICAEFRVYDTGQGICRLSCPSNMRTVQPTNVSDIPSSCEKCPLNTYADNSICIDCPTYSLSMPNSTSISDCICIAGTYAHFSTKECLLCGIGNYCPGKIHSILTFSPYICNLYMSIHYLIKVL
jgi:hypothetical protein